MWVKGRILLGNQLTCLHGLSHFLTKGREVCRRPLCFVQFHERLDVFLVACFDQPFVLPLHGRADRERVHQVLCEEICGFEPLWIPIPRTEQCSNGPCQAFFSFPSFTVVTR